MLRLSAILTMLIAISACNTTTTVERCPPFPEPTHDVAIRVSRLAHADPAGIGLWWLALAKYDAECTAINGGPK